jgi:effector-binding domain-containing protein
MVELEAALPVVASMAAGGRIERRADPAYRAIVALHQGPYDELPSVRSALENAMRMQGAAAAGPLRLVYLNNPEASADPRRHLTEVVLPIDVAAGWRPSDALFTEPLTP